jgi:hypothetical protein
MTYSPGALGQFALGQGSQGTGLVVSGGTTTAYIDPAMIVLTLEPITSASNVFVLAISPAAFVVTVGTLNPHFSNAILPLATAIIHANAANILLITPSNMAITEGMVVRSYAFPALGVAISQSVALHGEDAFSMVFSQTVRGELLLKAANLQTMLFGLTYAEHAVFKAVMTCGFPVAVNQTLDISTTLTVAIGAVILQRLSVKAAALPQATYNLAVAQVFRLYAGLAKFFGGDIHDRLGVGATASPQLLHVLALTQNLSLSAALAETLFIRVDLQAGVKLEDTTVLHMLFSGAITEGIAINAAYVDPTGTITTWVINTRNNFVTEYKNWNFNSFAKLNRRYIAANRDGIYELTGDTDAGALIHARIGGSTFQPNGSQFAGMKAAYLGMRAPSGASDMFLKIVTDGGTEYVYQINTQDMRTTRVNLGKGLRSRYYAWELITGGSDFDLDTIEFLPLMQQRRI